MERIKKTVGWVKILLIASVPAVVLGMLALQDIYHGNQPDFRLEWWMVRITFLTVIGLIVVVGILISRIQKILPGRN